MAGIGGVNFNNLFANVKVGNVKYGAITPGDKQAYREVAKAFNANEYNLTHPRHDANGLYSERANLLDITG